MIRSRHACSHNTLNTFHHIIYRSYATDPTTTTTHASLRPKHDIAKLAAKSKENLLNWVLVNHPKPSDSELMKSMSPISQLVTRVLNRDASQVMDHYAVVREMAMEMKKNKSASSSSMSKEDKEVINMNDPVPLYNEHSYFARMFGAYNRKKILDPGVELIWEILTKHINTYFPAKLYDSLNVSTPAKNWLNSEFYTYTFHLWAFYRRMRFEGKEGEYISASLCNKFWALCEIKVKEVGGLFPDDLRVLQQQHYGVCIALDEALLLDEDGDLLMAEVVWKNLYAAGFEEVYIGEEKDRKNVFKMLMMKQGTVNRSNAVAGSIVAESDTPNVVKQAVYIETKYLVFWVRYLRYLNSWLDHSDSILLKKGLFELHAPTSEVVQGAN